MALADSSGISPWTGERYPESLKNLPFKILIGFDSQVHERSAVHWMKFFDWDKIQADIEKWPKLARIAVENYSDGYINSSEMLEFIREQDPKIFDYLVADLELPKGDWNIVAEMPSEDTLSELFEEQNSANGEDPLIVWLKQNGAKSQSVIQSGKKQNGAFLIEETPTMIQRPYGLVIPSEEDMNQLGIEKVKSPSNSAPSAMQIINNRWKELSWQVRIPLFRLELLSAKQKVAILLNQRIMHDLGFEYLGDESLIETYGKNIPGEFKNIYIDFEFPISVPDKFEGLEMKFKNPLDSVTEFLDQFHRFNKFSNRMYYVKNPLLRALQNDGDNHIHFSLPDGQKARKQNLTGIAKAWNHLSVLTEISIGNSNWKTSIGTGGGFQNETSFRGYVKVVHQYHIEIRNQIYDPQTTLEQLIYLVKLDDDAMRKYVYGTLAPRLNFEQLKDIWGSNQRLFSELFMTKEFLEMVPQQWLDQFIDLTREKIENGENIDFKNFQWIPNGELEKLKKYQLDSLVQMETSTAGPIMSKIMLESRGSMAPVQFDTQQALLYGEYFLTTEDSPNIYAKSILNVVPELIDWYHTRGVKLGDNLLWHFRFLRELFRTCEGEDEVANTNRQHLLKYVEIMTPEELSRVFHIGLEESIYQSGDYLKSQSDESLRKAIAAYLESIRTESDMEMTSHLLAFLTNHIYPNPRLRKIYFEEVTSKHTEFHGRLLQTLRLDKFQEGFINYQGYLDDYNSELCKKTINGKSGSADSITSSP